MPRRLLMATPGVRFGVDGLDTWKPGVPSGNVKRLVSRCGAAAAVGPVMTSTCPPNNGRQLHDIHCRRTPGFLGDAQAINPSRPRGVVRQQSVSIARPLRQTHVNT